MAMGSCDAVDIVPSGPDMNYEKRRLDTFRSWPANAIVEPQRIAKAGFYSTGNDLEVKCFSCGKCISEWEYGDQVMAKHRTLSPDCAFVLNPLECGNVPLLPSVGSQADYRREQERLASFRGWSSPHVTPESLARNGLYYLREDDKVACAFCSVVLHQWQPGDRPRTEHRRASPSCPLLFGYIVGNVPIHSNGSGIEDGDEEDDEEVLDTEDSPGSVETSPEDYVEIRPFSVSGPEGNKQLASNPQFGVQAHKPPIHPRYQTYEARLASFVEWPNARPTPEALADAGFYYQGMLDHACCFHCNGGLHNWDPADDPWEEHARWFSRCPFVCLVKGRSFVQEAIAKKPPIMPISQVVGPPCQPEDVTGHSEHRAEEVENSGQDAEHRGQEETESTQQQDVGDVVTSEQAVLPEVNRESRHMSDGGAAEQPGAVEATTTEASEMINVEVPAAVTTAETRDDKATEEGVASAVNKVHNLSLVDGPVKNDLLEENRRLTEARLCKVCLDEDVGVVFLPCGHLITCVKCAPNLAHCPMCRDQIQATVRTFFS